MVFDSGSGVVAREAEEGFNVVAGEAATPGEV